MYIHYINNVLLYEDNVFSTHEKAELAKTPLNRQELLNSEQRTHPKSNDKTFKGNVKTL